MTVTTENVIKSLSKETKALILVSEFEARRMPMFQMRAVLNELIANEEEKKVIIDLVENDLKATGYHPNQINAFLQDLLQPGANPPGEKSLNVTRRLRSPFALGFEEQVPTGKVVGGSVGVMTGAAVASGSGANPVPPPPPPGSNPPAPSPFDRNSTPVPPMPLPTAAPAAAAPATPQTGPKATFATMGQRVSNAVVPADLAKPKVPVAAAPPAQPPEPLQPAGTRAGIGKMAPSAAFLGKTPAGMGMGVPAADRKPVILLADDDKRIRIVFKMAIERTGCTVLEAGDGNEAWKRIQEGNIDLAVLDMKMPGLHGLEVLSRIAGANLGLPVIICSAYDQLKDEFVVASYPKLRYLVKPVASEALEKAVRELLGLAAK